METKYNLYKNNIVDNDKLHFCMTTIVGVSSERIKDNQSYANLRNCLNLND